MGKIELDHTGAGSGITLSSDGTDLLLNGTAVGGGGGTALELYAENPSSPTAPSATGDNAVAIGSGAVASGFGAKAIGDSTASGTYSTAIGSLATASSSSSIAIGSYTNAGSLFSTAIGINSLGLGSVTASGASAMALGGSYASGNNSFAAAIASNTSSYGAIGANSVAIGYQAKATLNWGTAIGYVCVASGVSAFAIGNQNTASQPYALALGRQSVADKVGKFAFTGHSLSSLGQSQTGIMVLVSNTTDATPKTLTTDNSFVGPTNQIVLPNNSAYAFHGTIVARQNASSGTACAAWKVEGLIRREGSVGTTVLVNSATTVFDNTPAWGMALSADTTNGGLKIEVTGAAATNIRWVATIHTSEVTY